MPGTNLASLLDGASTVPASDRATARPAVSGDRQPPLGRPQRDADHEGRGPGAADANPGGDDIAVDTGSEDRGSRPFLATCRWSARSSGCAWTRPTNSGGSPGVSTVRAQVGGAHHRQHPHQSRHRPVAATQRPPGRRHGGRAPEITDSVSPGVTTSGRSGASGHWPPGHDAGLCKGYRGWRGGAPDRHGRCHALRWRGLHERVHRALPRTSDNGSTTEAARASLGPWRRTGLDRSRRADGCRG